MIRRLLSIQIIKNFSVLTGTNIAIQFLSIMSSIRLARLLQPAGYGLFNLMMIQAGLFSIIAVFGLGVVIIRNVARNKSDSKYLFNVSNQIRLVTTLLAVASLLIYNIFINKTSIGPLFLFLLSIYIIFQSLWDSIQCIAFGNERMEATGYINLLFTGLWVIGVYVIPKLSFNIENLLTIYVILQIIKTISYYYWLNKKIFRKDHPATSNPDINFKSIILQSNYYFVLAIFTAFQNQVPVLLLDHNSTLEQVGIFNLGYRILLPLQMVMGVALTALFPSFSRLASANKELFATRVRNLLNLVLLIGVWGCLCFTLFSKEVVIILYGKAYIESVQVILIQCWYTLLYSIFCTVGTVLSAFDKQRALVIITIVCSFIALPFYLIGTRYGAIGLAYAFVVSGFVNLTIPWRELKKSLNPYLDYSYSLKFILILFATAGLSILFPIEFSFWIKLALGLLITICVGYYIRIKVLKQIIA